MAYNAGLQLLLGGNYALALTCFQTAALGLHQRPRLWLRMGECAVQEHNKRLQVLLGSVRVPMLGRGGGEIPPHFTLPSYLALRAKLYLRAAQQRSPHWYPPCSLAFQAAETQHTSDLVHSTRQGAGLKRVVSV